MDHNHGPTCMVKRERYGKYMTAKNSDMSKNARRSLAALGYLLSAFLLTSCATVYVGDLADSTVRPEQYEMEIETGAASCRDALNQPALAGSEALDASNIRLVNWNIHKQLNPESGVDLTSISNGRDLILIQEASLREETINDVDATKHWSFAPGYRTAGAVSGVLTLSSIKPLTQCSFENIEPVLRSPKATSITEYGLNSSEQTLVVVNMHAVNFSTGLKAFRNQFRQVAAALRDHSGPVIFSGDLNTWRKKRLIVVDEFAASLGLEPIHFGDNPDDDHRVRFFGNVLDHIYVRGLATINTSTSAVTTSDHNPMSATFSL